MPMYDTPQEAFGELARRIQSLKKAAPMFRGLVAKLAAQQAVEMRGRAMSPQHKPHNEYADKIDAFATDKGAHVSVPGESEDRALAAEIGTTTRMQNPLWRPGFRRAERQADRLAQALLEAIAERVAAGEPMTAEFLNEIAPKTYLGPGGMDSLREILAAWEKEAARELKSP